MIRKLRSCLNIITFNRKDDKIVDKQRFRTGYLGKMGLLG